MARDFTSLLLHVSTAQIKVLLYRIVFGLQVSYPQAISPGKVEVSEHVEGTVHALVEVDLSGFLGDAGQTLV